MNKQDLRIIFMGTPEFAVGTLSALVEGGYQVVAVVTKPDQPSARHGSVMVPPEVKKYAMSQNIPVLQPEKMKDPDFLEQLQSYHADLQVVVAFRMLPEVVWAMPRLGTFNVHASLLPQYRGAAPINWAIINGETTTGVTTFFLDHQIDTGRIIMRKEFSIPDEADLEYVYDGLMRLGAKTALETIDLLMENDGNIPTIAQDAITVEEPLRPAPKIFKETCQVDWSLPTKRIYDFVRGLSPYPGAWTNLQQEGADKDIVLKIFKTTMRLDMQPAYNVGELFVEKGILLVRTTDGSLQIDELQLTGKKRMSAQAFLNGFKNVESYRVSK